MTTTTTYTKLQSEALIRKAKARVAAKRLNTWFSNTTETKAPGLITKTIAAAVVAPLVLAAIAAYAILGPIGFLLLLFFVGCFKMVALAVLSLMGLI